MTYLKKIFNKTSKTFRNLIKKFPLTLLVIAFATIFLTVVIEGTDLSAKTIGRICLFCVTFAVDSFAVENFFDEQKIFKLIGYIASGVIAFVFNLLIFNEHFAKYVTTTTRILIGYLFIIFLISIYVIIRKSKVDFKEYILKVFANVFNSIITYLVLNLGLTLITVIFVELLLDSWGYILPRIQILLLGLFYIPALINSIWDVKEKEVNTFFKGLVKFVLLPLVSIAMLIIYMYIIKILVLRQLPSNVIFRILAGIFVVAFPVWNMAENFKDNNKFIEKLTKLLPYFYMPFILLEIYSLYARILEFGITPVRYFGIVFIIIQVIALILTVVKKGEKLSHTFIYMAVLVLIAFVLPLNYDKVSILSQSGILKSEFPETLKYEELSSESKTRVSGAYQYLVRNNAEKYIPEYIEQYEEEIYDRYYSETYRNTQYIYIDNDEKIVDISQYSKLAEVSAYETSTNIKFYNSGDDLIATMNMEELLKSAVNSGNAEEYIEQNRLIKIDNTKDIYIRNLNTSYNKDTGEVTHVSINAYVLYR